MTKIKSATIAALGLSVMAGAAFAQSRGATSNQPISYGADSANLGNTSVSLRGRAEIQQGETRLRANAIEGTRDAQGAITRVEASGQVYFVTPTQTIRGDRALYNVSNATITVSGDVILTQGKNVLTGSSLIYNVDTEQAQIQGGSNGRVQGVFYPQGNAN